MPLGLRYYHGYKLGKNDRYVGRPSIYGNPFKISMVKREGKVTFDVDAANGFVATCASQSAAREVAVCRFREWVWAPERKYLRDRARKELRDKNLACWCPDDGGPCHRNVWLEIANDGGEPEDGE